MGNAVPEREITWAGFSSQPRDGTSSSDVTPAGVGGGMQLKTWIPASPHDGPAEGGPSCKGFGSARNSLARISVRKNKGYAGKCGTAHEWRNQRIIPPRTSRGHRAGISKVRTELDALQGYEILVVR